MTHPAVAERLARLASDQRAAATAPPGPVLCIAPAGSGKTTTLVARIAWLIDSGADPGSIAAITFNKRAADELHERLASALQPLGVDGDAVRVRTFHALGLEILRSAGQPVEPLVDRMTLLRQIAPGAGPAGWRRLDDAFSRLKLDLGVSPAEIAADPEAGPTARAFVAYEEALGRTGGLDFDDLVARSLRLLQADIPVLTAWRERCGDLLVDEVQDVDRSQLRLALLLAAPGNRIFLVGDDDQSIYGWRLADVRRVLALADDLPGLRRVDLTTNYRCPRPVVERAVRLIEENRERFAKVVRPRPGAAGRIAIAPDAGGGETQLRRFLGAALPDGQTRAVLARTNRELMLPLAIALEAGLAVRASATLLFEAPGFDALLAEVASGERATARSCSGSPSFETRTPRRRASRRSMTARPRRSSPRPCWPGPPRSRRTIARRSSSGWPMLASVSPSFAATMRRLSWRLPIRRRASSSTTLPSSGSRRADFPVNGAWRTPRTRHERWRRSAGSPTSRGPGPAAR